MLERSADRERATPRRTLGYLCSNVAESVGRSAGAFQMAQMTGERHASMICLPEPLIRAYSEAPSGRARPIGRRAPSTRSLGGGAGCGPLCATRIGPSYTTCAGPDQNGARSTRAALGGRAGVLATRQMRRSAKCAGNIRLAGVWMLHHL
jgi:hypothetical protein